MLLYYVRHGDPVYNPDSLTPLGKRQAEAAAKRLSMFGLDEIYASSSERAIQTARPTCEMTKKDMTILDWCNEKYAAEEFMIPEIESGHMRWAFHTAEGMELFMSKEMSDLGQNWLSHPFFEGKNFRAGYERIRTHAREFLAAQGFVFDEEKGMYRVEEKNEKRIAMFAHQGFGMAFLSVVLNVPYPLFSTTFDIQHSGVNVIEFKTDREYTGAKLLTLANDAHIYREGLPMKYQNQIFF